MKKRANLITRVALAATIFVTALAGVTPMTAKAAGPYDITYSGTPATNTTPDTVQKTTDTAGKFRLPDNFYTVPENKYFKAWLVGTDELQPGAEPTVAANTEVKAVWADYSLSVDPATVTYDKNAASADNKNIEINATLTGTDNAITSITSSAGTYTSDNISVSGTKITVFKSYLDARQTDSTVTITVNGKGTSTASTTISIKDTTPATTAFSATASATTYDKNATSKSAIKITGAGTNSKIYAITSGSNVNIATINSDGTATLETSYLDGLTSGVYEFKAWNTTSPTPETDTINITITGTNVTGTLAKIDSVKWRSGYNNADLGSIASEPFKTYTDNPRTVVYEISGTKEFPNGTPYADIISELAKTSQVEIDLDKESNNYTATVKWLTASKKSSTPPYNNSEADSDQMNTYDVSSKEEDTFIVYSDSIDIWGTEDKYYIDSAGAQNIRLKLKVKILKEGETANTSTSTGSSAPTNLTFNPGDGTYVTPNSIIRFSATASSGTVKYNVTSGNITPTTSNGADGANGVTIPGSVSAGDYKMNVNAYTNSSNTTTKSATFKVVTNNKYNVTYDNGVLTCDGDFGNFKGLWITNAAGQYEFVPAANYAVASGSTVVTLSPTYLMTQTGAKSVRMVYTDGYAEGNFTLTAGSSNTPTNITDPTAGNTNTSGGTQGGGRSGVGTDDRSELVIMFVLLGMLIAGFVVSVYYKNEKLRRNRYMD